MKSERNWGRLGMKSNWMTTTINDVCSLVTDGAHNSPKSVEKGRYMASVKDFTEFGFDFSNCRRISEEDYERLRKQGCVPEKDDILVGKDGARYFEDIVIYKQDEQPALLSSIAILRADRKKIIPEFLYYTLKTPAVKKNVRDNYGSGSAIPRIVLKDFKRMPFSFPSVDEQRKITAICSAIDSKIQVNNAINKNLEQQVSALYQSWFEDFDPTNGICPDNWSNQTLSTIADISSGKRPPEKSEVYSKETPIPIVGAASVMGFTSEANHTDKILVTGRVGTHGVIQRFNIPCWTSDNTLVITSAFYEFTNQILRRIDYSSMNRGSTQPLITQGDIKKVIVLVPDEETIAKFEVLAGSLMAQWEANNNETVKLASLRDTLLPKLMSGELDVSNIDL